MNKHGFQALLDLGSANSGDFELNINRSLELLSLFQYA